MATKLIKSVKREMLRMVQTNGKHRGKPIVVELLPGDDISFRVKGTRQAYSIYLGHCFRLAQIQSIDEKYKADMERYRLRGSKRMRKPKRSQLPYNSFYFKALSK